MNNLGGDDELLVHEVSLYVTIIMFVLTSGIEPLSPVYQTGVITGILREHYM